MANETLKPNIDSSPLQWGTFGGGFTHSDRVNSGVSTPDDTNGIRSTTEDEEDLLDFDDSTFVDADTITNVDISFRYKSSVGSADNKIQIALYIGGVNKGAVTTTLTNDASFHNVTVGLGAWDLDWTAAELDGLQVFIKSQQAGKTPVALQIDVSEIEVIITAEPPFVSYGVPFLYTAVNWTAGSTMYFETYMKATTGLAEARVYNVTDATAVANSTIVTTSGSLIRFRSAAFTLTDGKTYIAQFGAAKADAGEALGAKIINVQ